MIPTTNLNKDDLNHEEEMQVLIVRVVVTIATIKEEGMIMTEIAAPIITIRTMPTIEGSRRNGNNNQSDIDRLPPADMNELDDYMNEWTWHEVSGKTDREREEVLRKQEHGTAMILKLCRDVMNLEQLIQMMLMVRAATAVNMRNY